MAKWVRVLLDEGRLPDGSRLFSEKTARELMTIVTPLPIGTPPPELAALVRAVLAVHLPGLGVLQRHAARLALGELDRMVEDQAVAGRILDRVFWPPAPPPGGFFREFAAICQEDALDRQIIERQIVDAGNDLGSLDDNGLSEAGR